MSERVDELVFGDPRLPGRFWEKVVPGFNGCWIWTANSTLDGYGFFTVSRSPRRAHRIAYEALVGPIDAGLQLDHACRVRACCNPSHLEPVTPQENTLRGTGVTAANSKKTSCPKGHAYDSTQRGWRVCTQCHRDASRAYEARKRARLKAEANALIKEQP